MIPRTVLFLILHLYIIDGSTIHRDVNAKKTFKLEELVPLRPDLRPSGPGGQWISDSEFLFLVPGQGFNTFNPGTNQVHNFLNEKDLMKINGSGIVTTSKDGQYVLLYRDIVKIYRYSSIAVYHLYDLKTKELHLVADGALIQQCILNPSSKGALAYVHKNDVYYVSDITKPHKIRRLTTDGIVGEVYNGNADWIYEEEILETAEAIWFSKNGTYLAIASFNDQKVDSIVYPIYGEPNSIVYQYPMMEDLKYPKAGRTNPTVKVQVFNLKEVEMAPRLLQAPVTEVSEDHVLGSVTWSTDNTVIVRWLNRKQNVSVLVQCDVEENNCIIIRKDTEPNGWINLNEIFFSDNGNNFIDIKPMECEKNGLRYPHVVRTDITSGTITDLTPGYDTIVSILGWNQPTDTIIYQVSPSEAPWQRVIWAYTPIASRCVSCVLPNCATASATFTSDAQYATIRCSAHNQPPVTFMYNLMTNVITPWLNDTRLANLIAQYKLPDVKFLILELAEGVKAHVKLLLPPDLEVGKKYPLLLKVYAGPGSTAVGDDYSLDFQTYQVTNRSYILCNVDVRGSANLGSDAMFSVNNALGTYEITDTIDVTKKLIKMFDFIDPKRVGVWGWSYGGFVSGSILADDKDNIFKCAVSVAPVTSWLYYDSIYTERYMDTPSNNPYGYNNSDLVQKAANFRNKKYLLIHGTADDNVHFQNSMMLSKELQQLDIDFEEMTYADENHALRTVSRHLYHVMDHFWRKCFESRTS